MKVTKQNNNKKRKQPRGDTLGKLYPKSCQRGYKSPAPRGCNSIDRVFAHRLVSWIQLSDEIQPSVFSTMPSLSPTIQKPTLLPLFIESLKRFSLIYAPISQPWGFTTFGSIPRRQTRYQDTLLWNSARTVDHEGKTRILSKPTWLREKTYIFISALIVLSGVGEKVLGGSLVVLDRS